MPVIKIVGAIYIYPVAKYIGFAIGNILPRGKIGIESLIFHGILLTTA
jgi:hypothetical protein